MRYMPRVVVNLSYVAKLVISLSYQSRRSQKIGEGCGLA